MGPVPEQRELPISRVPYARPGEPAAAADASFQFA